MSEPKKCVEMTERQFIEYSDREFYILDLKADNERLKAQVDEISVLITQFKKARNSTRSIDAIAKIVVWNVEQEDRIGKEKREQLEATD